MKQTIEGLKVWANRLKLVTALGALFMSGALFSLTMCAWYYDRVISQIHGSYGGRIAAHNKEVRRLQKELDTEREITRKQLEALTVDMRLLLASQTRYPTRPSKPRTQPATLPQPHRAQQPKQR